MIRPTRQLHVASEPHRPGHRGVVRTDLSAPYFATAGYAADTAAATALHRIGEPEDVADAIVALLGAGARWITGQVIEAGGGYRL